MPHISEMFPSKYLKKEDIDAPRLVTISGIEAADVSMEGEPAKSRPLLWFKEFDRPMVLNPTNAQLIVQACQAEHSDGWMGKKIVLYVDPTVMLNGRPVGGIRVRAPKQGYTAPAPQPVQPPPPGLDDDIPF